MVHPLSSPVHCVQGWYSSSGNHTIVRVNRTFLEWMGHQREELLNGKRFQDLLTVGGKLFHETHYAPLLRLQGAVHEINFELVTKNGRKLPFLVNSVHKKDSAGRPVLTRTTLFNITDRKNYERELLLTRKKAQEAEQAARARADFVSMVSHEIRTPMNAIIGLAQLLIQTRLSAEQEKYLHILQSSSENLLSLVNNILDFSKIEASKLVLEERRFDLRQLTYGIFYGLNIKAEQKGLAVRVELDEQLPTALRGDPVKLGQVLTNLLANAIKFTEQGSVTLAARVRQCTAESVLVEFRVTDTGIGIPRDRQAQIFEEFTQASYDIHLKYGGTGLGLAICQKLLALYDTRLDVESEPGVGSSFSFSLPLKVAPDEQPSQQSTGKLLSKERSLQGLRVLVAEDNTVNNMAEGDPHALREFNAIVVHNAEQSKKDFQEALCTGDLEAFDFFAHKLKMTLELLQAHVLSTALSEGQRLLLEKVREPARLQTAILAIHTELDAIILALKDEA